VPGGTEPQVAYPWHAKLLIYLCYKAFAPLEQLINLLTYNIAATTHCQENRSPTPQIIFDFYFLNFDLITAFPAGRAFCSYACRHYAPGRYPRQSLTHLSESEFFTDNLFLKVFKRATPFSELKNEQNRIEYLPQAFLPTNEWQIKKCGLRALQQNRDLHAGHTRHACASFG
jgi:hypothetical protein